MKRSIYRWASLLQIGLVVLAGCHPTQPFFLAEDGDLSHYLETATKTEYPDLQVESLPEATEAQRPFMSGNHNFDYLDLTLQECIDMALANSKVLRSPSGSFLQNQDIALQILSSPSSQLGTGLDAAITSSTANTQGLVIDQNGNRTLPRGAIRANQVGGIEDALSEFDAQYSTFLAHNTTDRQRNAANIFTPSIFTARDSTYQNALSKRLATGGVATARSQTIYSANNVSLQGGTARVVPSDYTQILEMQIQHPLARGRGTMVNRIPVVLARINEDIALNGTEEKVRNLVRDVESMYWELYCAYWAVETAKLGHQSALKVYRVAEPRAAVGQSDLAVFWQAKAQAQQFEGQLNAALNGVNLPGGDAGVLGRERKLRMYLGLAPTDGRVIRPIDRPTVARIEFDWCSIQAEALNRNLDVRTQKWLVKQRELELISAKNQILPDVNISALYRWLGVGDDLLTRNGGPEFPGATNSVNRTSAWESLLGGNYQEAAFRLEFTPNAMGARRPHSLIRSAQLSLAREHVMLQEKELALTSALSEAYAFLHNHYEQMLIKLNQWNSSEMDAKIQLDKYEVGAQATESLVDALLRSQERRARSQQEYYRAVCEYNKSIIQIHSLKGSLLDYNNISLGEGPWADKAYWDANERARERDAATFLDYGSSRPAVVSRGPVERQYLNGNGTENGIIVDEGDRILQPMGPAPSMPQEFSPMPIEGMKIPPVEEVKPVPVPKKEASRLRFDAPKETTTSSASPISPAGGTRSIADRVDSDKRMQWNSRPGTGSIGTGVERQGNPLRTSSSAVQQASFDQPIQNNAAVPSNSLRR